MKDFEYWINTEPYKNIPVEPPVGINAMRRHTPIKNIYGHTDLIKDLVFRLLPEVYRAHPTLTAAAQVEIAYDLAEQAFKHGLQAREKALKYIDEKWPEEY